MCNVHFHHLIFIFSYLLLIFCYGSTCQTNLAICQLSGIRYTFDLTVVS